MSNTTSIPNQVRLWLSRNPGFHTTREIAEALGLETKPVSSAISKLVKADRIVREDGKVADPTLADEVDQNAYAEAAAAAGDPKYDVTDEEPAQEPEEASADEPTEEPTVAPEEEEEDLEPVVVSDEPGRKFDIEDMKTKIAKLLAKAEGTDNEKERDSFNAKAEKLMLKLGIQRAELESAGEVKPEEIVEVVREWTGNYSIVMVPFTHSVASGFGNLTVLQQNVSAMLRRTFIIGHKSDVEAFTTLLDSLSLQAMSALHRWQREHAEERRGLTDMEKYVQHRSFLAGFGQEVGNRLGREQRQVKKEEHISKGAELVLASKMDRVTNWVDETYGELKTSRGGMKYGDREARAAGRDAGKNADLGHKSVASQKAIK